MKTIRIVTAAVLMAASAWARAEQAVNEPASSNLNRSLCENSERLTLVGGTSVSIESVI